MTGPRVTSSQQPKPWAANHGAVEDAGAEGVVARARKRQSQNPTSRRPKRRSARRWTMMTVSRLPRRTIRCANVQIISRLLENQVSDLTNAGMTTPNNQRNSWRRRNPLRHPLPTPRRKKAVVSPNAAVVVFQLGMRPSASLFRRTWSLARNPAPRADREVGVGDREGGENR